MKFRTLLSLFLVSLLCLASFVAAEGESDAAAPADASQGAYDGFSSEEAAQLREKAESFHFQAETSRLMNLIINSLYKNKEIFLRELISNGSDALDKIRFLALTGGRSVDSLGPLEVKVQADKDANLLIITDTGVGMTRQDMQNNLGTIAKSGTAEFLGKMEAGEGDMGLIGQFGVGFYSAFLVADTVTVVSKHDDDEQHIWESTSDGVFTIVKDPRGNTLGRGTRIILHLKEEAKEYTQDDTLKNLIKKYSEFINFPISLWTTKTETVEVPDDSPVEKEETEAAEGEEEVEDGEEEEEEEGPRMKKVQQTTSDFEQVNTNKPIWTRPIEEVTAEEYVSFYKSFSKETQDPLGHIHFKAEGEVEFRSILYIPGTAPGNLFSSAEMTMDNIKLYVRRVFITDMDVEGLLPKYLKFIKGIVDSDDLPLNISRETLQQHKMLKVIKKKLTRKALDMIKKIADDSEEKYEKFLDEYATSLKLGIMEDASNRKRLSKLLRFKSSVSEANEESKRGISLDSYVERMKKNQESIFFLAGASLEEIKSSPFLERLQARGYEVLFMHEPIDEYCLQSMTDYEGHKFQNVAKEGLKFGDEDEDDKEAAKALEETFKPLGDYLKGILSKTVEKVVVSNRLTTSPVALVASQYGWSGNMERIMRAQAYAQSNDPMAQYHATQKKVLEINPKHPIIKALLARVEAESTDDETALQVRVLVDTAILRSGFIMTDHAEFAERIDRILRSSLGLDRNEKIEVNEKPAPEAEAEEEAEEAEEVVGDERDEL